MLKASVHASILTSVSGFHVFAAMLLSKQQMMTLSQAVFDDSCGVGSLETVCGPRGWPV